MLPIRDETAALEMFLSWPNHVFGAIWNVISAFKWFFPIANETAIVSETAFWITAHNSIKALFDLKKEQCKEHNLHVKALITYWSSILLNFKVYCANVSFQRLWMKQRFIISEAKTKHAPMVIRRSIEASRTGLTPLILLLPPSLQQLLLAEVGGRDAVCPHLLHLHHRLLLLCFVLTLLLRKRLLKW